MGFAGKLANALVPGGPPFLLNIIANELAERFCYYGIAGILVSYLKDNDKGLGYDEAGAVAVHSYFMCAVYLAPLVGGFIADTFWGRYNTILRFSCIYLIGTILLGAGAFIKSLPLSFIGLFVVALGTGGIKPCVAPFGVDQLRGLGSAATTSFVLVFYASVNVGSLLTYIIVPVVRDKFGYGYAFLCPTVALFLAIIFFAIASKKYHRIPPGSSVFVVVYRVLSAIIRNDKDELDALEAGHNINTPFLGANKDSESAPLVQNIDVNERRKSSIAGTFDNGAKIVSTEKPLTGTWLDKARGKPKVTDDDIQSLAAVWRLLPLFTFIIVYWSISNSTSSVWVLIARRSDRCFGNFCISTEQVALLNPVFIVTLIPLVDKWLLPILNRSKYTWLHPKPLRRMTVGLGLASTAMAMSAVLRTIIDEKGDGVVHIAWMIPQYFVLTVAELFVSTTGLEFAYREAPPRMKSMLLSIFYLTNAAGSALNGVIYNAFGKILSGANLIWLFAGLMAVCVIFFGILAYLYIPNAQTAEFNSGKSDKDSVQIEESEPEPEVPYASPDASIILTENDSE